MRRWILVLLLFVTGCSSNIDSIPVTGSNSIRGGAGYSLQILTPTLAEVYLHPPKAQPSPTITPTATVPAATQTPVPTATASPSPSPTPTLLPADRWMEWPVMPAVPEYLHALYRQGIARGNNPHAFSIFGDCQSEPEVFLGSFEADKKLFSSLPPELQQMVTQFAGSFNRYSPTVRSGTTAGALLWPPWNNDQQGLCKKDETPVDCELRIQKPSIVLILVGTHWEARNKRYLTLVIDKVLESGAIPVLATKADNREGDERLNREMAELAAEYNLPLWNFWASVQDLPNAGMQPGSDMYLNDAGLERHRIGALQVLEAVYRAASNEEVRQP